MNNNIFTFNIGGITTLWIINDIFIENLYENIGRYDYVACYTLKPDSESYNNYGADVTGTLVYTRNERENLEQSYKSGNKNIGKIRINESNLELSEDKRRCLKEDGIEITDIQYICVIPMPHENLYINDTVRKPRRIEITLPDDVSYVGCLSMKQNLYVRCIEENRELCPHEWNEYLAFKYINSPNGLTVDEKQKIYDTDNHIKEEIVLSILCIKKEMMVLSDDRENEALLELKKREWTKKLLIFEDALRNNGTSFAQMKQKQSEKLTLLLVELIKFHPIRLNTLAHRHAIYLDLEGYLHMLLRHVNQTSVSYKPIEDKTKLMWNFEDFEYAIKGVIGVIADEYDKKRDLNDKTIYWKGNHSIEFCGDYYDLYISSTGRVETCFRRHNNILGK